MIEHKAALDLIKTIGYRDNKGSFKVAFLKCNRHKKTGGQWVILDNACSCGLPPNCNGHEMVGIRDMQSGKEYAVHNRLIFELNEQEIYWV